MEQSMNETIMEKIRLTFKDNNKPGKITYKEWRVFSPEEQKKLVPKLTCLFNIGWNQRFLRGRYNSPSGHAFLIGARSKKFLLKIVLGKKCYTFGQRRNLNEEQLVIYTKRHKNHNCTCNFDGSSKSIEAEAFVGLSTKMFIEKNCGCALRWWWRKHPRKFETLSWKVIKATKLDWATSNKKTT